MKQSGRSVYQNIALDIASRIARQEIEAGTKLSGRSTLSSEYGVSPETIRRSLSLLKEHNVVDVRSNAGVIVKDKAYAMKYLERIGDVHDATELKHQLSILMEKRRQLDEEIDAVITQLVDLAGRFSGSDPLRRFEIVVYPKSHLVGKSIADSQFFQHTKMTIVALNRGGQMILSPGPDAVFEKGDKLILMGSVKNIGDLESWMNHEV